MNKYLLKIIIFVVLIAALLIGLVMNRFEATSRLFFILEMLALLLLITFCATIIPKALYHYHLYLNRRTYRRTTEDCAVYYNDSEIILCPENHSVILHAPGEPVIRIPAESSSDIIGNAVLESLAASHMIAEEEIDSEFQKIFERVGCKNYRDFESQWRYISISRPLEGNNKNQISIWFSEHQKETGTESTPNSKEEKVSLDPAAIGDAILKIIRP